MRPSLTSEMNERRLEHRNRVFQLHIDHPMPGSVGGLLPCQWPNLDLERLTADDLWIWYHTHYWHRAGCDQMPMQVATVAFAGALALGPRRAVRHLQRQLLLDHNREGCAPYELDLRPTGYFDEKTYTCLWDLYVVDQRLLAMALWARLREVMERTACLQNWPDKRREEWEAWAKEMVKGIKELHQW